MTQVVIVMDLDSGDECVYINGVKRGFVEYMVDLAGILESACLIGQPICLHRIECEYIQPWPEDLLELPEAWNLPEATQ